VDLAFRLATAGYKSYVVLDAVAYHDRSAAGPKQADDAHALANKQKAKSFEILFKELSGGREPHYIFSMIVYQFRNLLAVKDLAERGLNLSAIQQKLKLHPFVARKLVAASQKFSLPDLKAKYQMLCGLDIAFKEGRVDLTDSLYNFVLA